MALNPKEKPGLRLLDFTDGSQEHLLFDSVLMEFTDISGWDVEIFLHNPTNVDYLYGESPIEDYSGPYRTKAVYKPTSESINIDVFGFEFNDEIQNLYIPKTMWERDVTDLIQVNRQPRPKDVIRTLWNNKLYEATFVGAEDVIFQGRKMAWNFILKPFRYSAQSDSVESMMETMPTSADFPFENLTVETFSPSEYNSLGLSGSRSPEIQSYTSGTKPLSAFGDNAQIEAESNNIFDNPTDTSVYGYDTL